jgi:midasin
MFAGKHGFITPRDLFKWAGRGAVGYQELAESGYMLLAERLRDPAERAVVQHVIQDTMRVKVCPLMLGHSWASADLQGSCLDQVMQDRIRA